ncbi:hypothetical protein FO519_003106 [Halicephalobus sp. NKZ332]|nr:hypothetical protein FO519_003106 [Halicephalobus sp. NKZ332]
MGRKNWKCSQYRPQANFQWSVEQQARVNPAIIDENFHYESPANSDIDSAIQRRLDDFWSQPLIDPSPEITKMMNNGPKPLNFSPSPITNVSLSRRISARHMEYNASPVSRNRVMISHEAQTDISIPGDFDLAALLADHLPCKGQVSSTPIKNSPREHKVSTPKFDLQEVRLGVDLTFGEEGPSTRTEDDVFSNLMGFKDPFESSSVSPIKFEPLMESVFHQLSPIKETRE